MDKNALLFAAVELLAEETGHKDLAEYLGHNSQHSADFIAEVDRHKSNIANLDVFKAKHEEMTHPEGVEAETYTKAELDALVAKAVKDAVKKARAE